MGLAPTTTAYLASHLSVSDMLNEVDKKLNVLGIVVKMGVWLMNNPGGFQSYCVTIPTNEDLHQAIEVIRDLRLKGVIQNSPTLRHVLMDAAMAVSVSTYTWKVYKLISLSARGIERNIKARPSHSLTAKLTRLLLI